MGYGARALQALESFYRGEVFDLDESEAVKAEYTRDDSIDEVRILRFTCDTLPHRGPLAIHTANGFSSSALDQRPATATPNSQLGETAGARLHGRLVRHHAAAIAFLEARKVRAYVCPPDEERTHWRVLLRHAEELGWE